jgi:serine/threonine protein phosphatase PrpC
MRTCFTAAQISNRGGRNYNEDHTRSAMANDTACWVVADGLGGHGGGADASAIACEAAIRSFEANPTLTPAAVRSHIEAAHQAVLQQQTVQPALASMRTTIVMLIANATDAAWGHVGDSRLYHLHAGKIVNQTRDHSVPQNLVEAGEITIFDIRHHEDRNRLLRSLGEEQVARPTVVAQTIPLSQGDSFLLCSDGFWENVYELEMELDFAKSSDPGMWLSFMETRLQERVDGSHDNYTAVAIIGDGLSAAPASTQYRNGSAGVSVNRNRLQDWLLRLTVFVFAPLLLWAYAAYIAPPDGWFHHIRMHFTSAPKAVTASEPEQGGDSLLSFPDGGSQSSAQIG